MANKRNNWQELLEMANKDVIKHDKRIDIHEDNEGYFSIAIITPSNGHQFPFAENLFEYELDECINDAWANVRTQEIKAEEKKKTLERDKLIQETIVLLSADLFNGIYSPDNGMGYCETAAEIISLAERFEKELDWQGEDDTRDYILELEKFENKVLKEREFNINLQELLQTETNCRLALVKTMLQFVNEHGDDVTDYEINEFGLDEGREGEGAITKVWNFFDNGGCWFNEDDGINSEKLESINDKNWYDKLYEGVTHTAYQCLYIVVDKDGVEHLKYYRFYNGGVVFDEDQAEPDHGYVSKLPLLDLSYIIEAIRLFSKQE
jgi:hypothetical protein